MLKRVFPLIPLFIVLTSFAGQAPGQYQSAFLRLEFAPHQPAFVVLAVDSLGKSKLSVSSLRPLSPSRDHYALSHSRLEV